MANISENDICINFGFINDCRKCDNMCDFKCENYESKNTRKVELGKLYNSKIIVKTESGMGFTSKLLTIKAIEGSNIENMIILDPKSEID